MWKEKTFYRGGGDVPSRDEQHYRYQFKDKWTRIFTPYQVEFILPFSTLEINTNGCTLGHLSVLRNPDFCIRDSNVIDWARSFVHKGKADFLFVVDAGDPFEQMMKDTPAKCFLRARFSDKGLASLFKLTFG